MRWWEVVLLNCYLGVRLCVLELGSCESVTAGLAWIRSGTLLRFWRRTRTARLRETLVRAVGMPRLPRMESLRVRRAGVWGSAGLCTAR
jgi:hypothetical protein